MHGNHSSRRIAASWLAALALAADVAGAVSIRFDYRYDAAGFFDPATPAGALARESLAAAAQTYADFSDTLTPIAPAGGDAWSTTFLHPGASGFATVTNLPVPGDTLVVFVGARPLVGALGFAVSGSVASASGSPAFLEALAIRGQPGALRPVPADFGPWGGSITFNANAPWHLDPLTLPAAGRNDFLTTATHELGHLLGVGNAPSWDALVVDHDADPNTPPVFAGPGTAALHGGPVPLDAFGGHFAEGVTSVAGEVLQETLMDPSTPAGVREVATALDLAAWEDIGWTIVPEPSTAALVLAGLTPLVRSRRRSA